MAKGKLNRKRALALAERGISPAIIAKDQQVACSTVTRYLDSVAPQLRDIKRYSTIKADTLCLSQLRKQTVEDMIIGQWLDDPSKLLSQDTRLQKEILHTIQGGKYYDHQAERLERDQSTANMSVLIGHLEALQRGDAERE